jgi:outer membrane protein assembly factor BamB
MTQHATVPATSRAPTHSPGLSDTGERLDPSLQHWIEQRIGVELGEVRIHHGPEADRHARLLQADAFTCGRDICFAAGAFRPHTRDGLRLLVHEIVHVVQQTSGTTPAPAPDGRLFRGRRGDRWEHEADDVAERVVNGMPVRLGIVDATSNRVDATVAGMALQCHDSFEHRALGDIPTGDVSAILVGGPRRSEILNREIDLMWLWHQDPEKVTEEDIHKLCPWIRTVRLPASGLLVTYGELNALPDYIATAETADTITKEVLLPIVQYVRQESYIQLNRLLNKTVTDAFADAIFSPSQWAPGLVNTLLATTALDTLTARLGIDGVDHYQGLLARNACHFAPFSWHRWQSSHLIARDLAARAFAATDPNQKAQLTHQAWIQHGYGDHFLQDSFAAGHLVNKTLIMQWFVEWAANQALVPVLDWDSVKTMTTTLQPGLAGRGLYDPADTGPSNDPQTAQEHATYLDRLQSTGLTSSSGQRDVDYQNYLSFLSSVITQSSSAAIHDYYNAHSLWVASPAHPDPYEVWGDDTLLSGTNGGTGAEQTSQAAQMSQQSIQELLHSGSTSVSVQQVREQFPTRVRTSGQEMLTLEAWNDTQQQFCGRQIFPALHDVIVRMSSPLISNVSRDQDLTPRWCTSLPAARFTTTSMLTHGDRLFAGSNGYVYELEPDTGDVLHSLRLSSAVGTGDYETRMTTDGRTLFVGAHGYVYGVDLADWSRPAWTTSLPDARYAVVAVLAADGRLFAGSNGYVYDIAPSSGHVSHSIRLGGAFGTGDYTMRLALDATTLVVGCHGYVYGVPTATFRAASWECSLPKAGYHLVDVLVHRDRLFAGSNGRVFELEPTGGRIVRQLLVTAELGVGDYTTTLAAHDHLLLAGAHGYVYGIDLDDWSHAKWSANLAGNRYAMINLAATADQLIAGSYGHVYRIDSRDGRVLVTTPLTLASGVGNYETRLAIDRTGEHCYAGVHGYGYKLSSELRA